MYPAVLQRTSLHINVKNKGAPDKTDARFCFASIKLVNLDLAALKKER